jgi:plasmid stabilization system protein ParE
MRLPLLPEALDELDWEMLHLDSERPGWGDKLLDEVARVAELAAEHPQLGEKEADLPDQLDVRRIAIRRFGCLVIVGLVDGERTIIAVAPGRKEPGYWRERLEK